MFSSTRSDELRRLTRTIGLLAIAYAVVASPCKAQDTLVVEAGGRAAWGVTVGLQVEVQVGSLDGSEEETFGLVGAVAIGPGGEIVVADVMVPAVRVFDSLGHYLRSLGRNGQGPGEFSTLRGLSVTPTGHVATWDPGNQRVSEFDLLGEFYRSFQVPTGLLSSDALATDTAGRYYVRAFGRPAGSRSTERPYVWLRYDSTGQFSDTLPIPPPRPNGSRIALMTGSGPLRPFPVETVSALSPFGYQVSGRNNVIALFRPLSDGRTVKIVREGEIVDVHAEERSQWQALLDEMAVRSGRERAETVPAHKPAFRSLWIDADGRIWAWRYVPAEWHPDEGASRTERPPIDWRERPTWDVFSPRGALLGTITLPHDSYPAAATGRNLWVVETGSLGEQYVTRYAIVPSAPLSPDPAKSVSGAAR